MSASLVGSEMCIRDRGSRWVPPLGSPQGFPWLPPGLPLASPWVPLGSVSYTHLTLTTICSV
eukprot:9292994-Alexandrium_andersonii.AAC.1